MPPGVAKAPREINIVWFFKSAAKDKITAETLADYVTITFDPTAKTITFTGHSTADNTHTATVLCDIIADGVATPVAVVVNFTV